MSNWFGGRSGSAPKPRRQVRTVIPAGTRVGTVRKGRTNWVSHRTRKEVCVDEVVRRKRGRVVCYYEGWVIAVSEDKLVTRAYED